MKKFSFPLETARRWRERQAEIEEVRLQALFAEKQSMEDRVAALQAELEAEHRRIEDTSFDAGELARLDEFRVWVMRDKQRLRSSLADCEKRIAAQRAVLVETRRRFQLVDRLKDKALLEWGRAGAKEQEDLAAELYLARRGRGD
jgi:flagellar export protein FliJ